MKRCKRKKALLGSLLISSGIAALGSLIGSAINANAQNKANERILRNQTLANNQSNAIQSSINESQNINQNRNNEIETMKTDVIKSLSSQESAFKYGGKRRYVRDNNMTNNIKKRNIFI